MLDRYTFMQSPASMDPGWRAVLGLMFPIVDRWLVSLFVPWPV